MLEQRTIEAIADEIISRLQREGKLPNAAPQPANALQTAAEPEIADITSQEQKAIPTISSPEDYEGLLRMKAGTKARIGVGRCGPRLLTKTLLTLRADHALARDAVFTDVNPELLKKIGLLPLQSRCEDKNTHITRPDLGRQLSDDAAEKIRQNCKQSPDVQLIVSDGLSSKAIEANIENVLPSLQDGLQSKGLSVGTPVFVRFGRVAVEDAISELLNAKAVCILIGERPGLGTAESMSAYICYNAKVGQQEARRTVVSNIHKDGISAVEAGAYIAELIEKVLNAKASGVELKQ